MSDKAEAINEGMSRDIKLARTERAERDTRTFDRLRGKVALVVGGANGMGVAEARLYVREGDRGKALAEELGDAAVYVHLDTRSESDWAAGTDTAVSTFGRLNVLVNNAGLARYGTIQEVETSQWFDLVDIMLWSGDAERARAVGDQLDCGEVSINRHGAAVRPDLLFSGSKSSGIGVENGHWGLQEYTQLQAVAAPARR
ncbi:SDR family NAD(P)-dependent oxidoreductase [Nocardia rhamnosiphila]|uniref:SDR family NAD(P)-dependent oxidoreductase n=1 Tax=Nocardia rhamnosiphila TaxID=426716 RepID=A0ABV2WRD6_9NOCA